MNNIQEILQKLDAFIRKYYLNQVIRGLIYASTLGLFLVLIILLLEYLGNFNSQVRTILFYGAIISLSAILIYFILIPLAKYLRIGDQISREKASDLVGKHFTEVSDKLKNLLQLSAKISQTESDLLIAGIEQKVKELKPVPFSLAVDLGENRKYLKYLTVPLLAFLLAYFLEPSILSESGGRLIAHSKDFAPSAPYDLNIINENLKAIKNQDFTLRVKASGKEIPSSLLLVENGEEFLMRQHEKGIFEYNFKNVQEETTFYLSDGQFDSPDFSLELLTPPSLISIEIEATFPPYIKRRDETFSNSGDITVPEGSNLRWRVETEATEQLGFLWKDSTKSFIQSGENEFKHQLYAKKSGLYGLILKNRQSAISDTIYYNLKVIPDLKPQISLSSRSDSLNPSRIYFEGIVKDDYGFSGLYFHSRLIKAKKDSAVGKSKVSVPIKLDLTQSKYYYAWDASAFSIEAGDRLEYYFEVWDNDGVNGRKSARTSTAFFSAPNKKEIEKKKQENQAAIKDELSENIELSKQINRELQDLKKKMINKKTLGFQEKKQLEELLKKQKELKNSVEELKKKQKENNRLDNQFSEPNESIVEKQKQLEELFEKVMDEEMRKLLDEMEKLMQEFNKEKLQESLEKMELSNEQLEKELDRNLELFKQFEVEKELAESIEKLDEIKKKQEELKEKTEEKKADKEELDKEQSELNEEFEDLDKKLDELEKKNEELEIPNEMEKTQSLEEQIKQDMKESLEQIQKGNNSKSSEEQEEAGEGMEELSESLASMQMKMKSSQSAENIEDLRSLLENLITLSFEQEALMQELKETERDDPRYVSLAQQQRKLQDDSKLIEDSLFALSKRVMSLSSIVNKEVSSINYNMGKAIDLLGERNTPMANNRQQLAMTSINNLALLLDEAVQRMQAAMQKSGSCDKPGSGKPKPGNGAKMGNMKSLQEQLNNQLKSLKDAMGKGKKPGEKGSSGQGMPGMSKEIAQMAAKQAAIRKAIEKMQDQMDKETPGGSGSGNLKKLAELMEQTETDLVNKQISQETLMRQEEIMSRLLESEKAERQREKEKRRESREFTDEINRNPNLFLEYNRRKQREVELIQTLPPSFRPFYKDKVTEYFNKIEQ